MEILAIILISGVFALLQIFKIKDRFAQAIHGLFVVSIGLSFVEVPAVRMDAFYLFGMTTIAVIVYAIHNSEFELKKRIIIATMGFIQLVGTVFILSQWPYIPFVSMLGLITIGSFIYILTKELQSYKTEIGFLVVLVGDATVKILVVVTSLLGSEAA